MITKIKSFSLVLISAVALLAGCEKKEYSFGDFKTPADLTLTATVAGVDASNPNGNGTGRVVITTTAKNAITYNIDFGDGKKSAMSVPWGDVSTAFYTTGIPNIEVFVPAFPKMIMGAKMMNYLRPVLKLNAVQKFIKSRIEKTVVGPNEELRAKVPTYVWGEARNTRGEIKTARIQTENAYSLTVNGSLTVVNYLLKNTVKGGTYTPAKLMGYKLVTELPGSGPLVIN